MLTRYLMFLLSVGFFIGIVGEVPGRCANPPVIKPLKWQSPGTLHYRWNKGDKDTIDAKTVTTASNGESKMVMIVTGDWTIECMEGDPSRKLQAVPGKPKTKMTLNGVLQQIDDNAAFPFSGKSVRFKYGDDGRVSSVSGEPAFSQFFGASAAQGLFPLTLKPNLQVAIGSKWSATGVVDLHSDDYKLMGSLPMSTDFTVLDLASVDGAECVKIKMSSKAGAMNADGTCYFNVKEGRLEYARWEGFMHELPGATSSNTIMSVRRIKVR